MSHIFDMCEMFTNGVETNKEVLNGQTCVIRHVLSRYKCYVFLSSNKTIYFFILLIFVEQ